MCDLAMRPAISAVIAITQSLEASDNHPPVSQLLEIATLGQE